ncbi:MAG TPA: hypothetical protein VK932_30090 [Kofleriaceae bacterium]|nr:hypothetical protein [Kofleriaceae bacterium]
MRWTATRAGTRWQWDSADAASLKIQTDARGGGGQSVDAWARASADRIVVHVQAIDDVTIDADAEADAMAPGHARTAQDAGDGSMARLEPGRRCDPRGEERGEGRAPDTGRGNPSAIGAAADREQDEALGPSEADEKLADDFERELGLGVDLDGTHDGSDDGEGQGQAKRAATAEGAPAATPGRAAPGPRRAGQARRPGQGLRGWSG